MKREDIFQKAENSDFDEILSFLLEFPCPGAARTREMCYFQRKFPVFALW